MSATAFQRKRRELLEQTSVAARMNEDGEGDPYAKTYENYDEEGVKDEGTRHQQGDPPPYSETPHVPEKLEQEPGEKHQAGDPPLTTLEQREGEEPPYADQERYDATDKREEPTAQASEENAEVGTASLEEKNVSELKDLAKERGVENYSGMKKQELLDALKE